MKKLKLFTLAIIAILVITGCGSEKKLTCTNNKDSNGLKMDQEIVMKFKDKKVNYIQMTIDAKATNDTIKNNWDMFATQLESQYKETKEDGINLTVKNDKKNYSYKISLEVDLTKASEASLKKHSLDNIANKNSSIEDVKKEAEKSGFTCK
ncbi:MAG: hypothetical protein PUB18_02375 [bacterium]|nr:hypothetical protein [bacterium]